uniref:MAGUK p55 subfamily member 7 n=1 Tax=Panagrellus redivivus TaxID=6233 RepID=A0A7E4VYY2_PANRE
MATNADFPKFSQTLDLIMYQQKSPFEATFPTLHKQLYKLVCKVRSQKLIPKKCKSTTLDLLAHLEKSHELGSSSTGRQLLALLRTSYITSLLEAYDEVARTHWNVSLPEVSSSSDVENEDGPIVKVVQLVKSSEPLGATIKYTADGSVFIARLIAGGAAEKSESIFPGDQILSINGVNVDKKEPKDIVALLNSSENSTVTFKILPTKLRPCLSAEKLYKNKFLRAMVDYDPMQDGLHPCPTAGLSFSRGDFLEVLHCDDRHWMQARCIEQAGAGPSHVGVIPTDEQLSLYHDLSTDENDKNRFLPGYEPICQLTPKSDAMRTLVLIGPPGVGRNELKRRLLLHQPHKYVSTVPHTCRPPRPHEKDGIDYHFVSRPQMEEWLIQGRFIESGEYNGNLYGTLDDALLTAISRKQMPVINAHPVALRVLRTARFKPLIVFVQPPDIGTLKKTRGKLLGAKSVHTKRFSDADLEAMVTTSKTIEANYGHLFDASIVNDNLETAFATLLSTLQWFETMPCWVPADWLVSSS